jgi:hypothetical protein
MVEEVTIEDLETPQYPGSGIIPQSWYDFFSPEEETIEYIRDLDDDISVQDVNLDDDRMLDRDWWGSSILPEYVFPAIDKGYDVLSDIDLSEVDAGNISEDLIRSQINALAGAPEMLWNVAKLPVEGAIDFAKGDVLGMLENIPNVLETSDPLKYNKDDPYGLYSMAEYPLGIFAARKLQNFLQSKLPTKAANIYKNLYPYWSSFADPAKKGIKQMTWPAIRGLGQYGLASTGIGAFLSTALQANNDQMSQKIVGSREDRQPTAEPFTQPQVVSQAPYEDRIMRMARNEAQGPRNNYQGL